MNDKLKNLAIRLLDDDYGITEEAYSSLLDAIGDDIATELNRRVKAIEGRYYLPEDHGFQAWKLDQFDNPFCIEE
jgi:hypothetical protein